MADSRLPQDCLCLSLPQIPPSLPLLQPFPSLLHCPTDSTASAPSVFRQFLMVSRVCWAPVGTQNPSSVSCLCQQPGQVSLLCPGPISSPSKPTHVQHKVILDRSLAVAVGCSQLAALADWPRRIIHLTWWEDRAPSQEVAWGPDGG